MEQAVRHIEAPKKDGFQCHHDDCRYICKSVFTMQKHYRDKHGWINPTKRGRNFRGTLPENREVPWRKGVWCQRLFPRRAVSQWFEVLSMEERSVPVIRGEDMFMKCVEEMRKKLDAAEKSGDMQAHDQKAEPNAWLGRTGWKEHLGPFDNVELVKTTAPVSEEGVEERILGEMSRSMERVMDAAQKVCHRRTVGINALFEINRRDNDKKAKKPFDARMESDSWARYKQVMLTIIAVIYRTEEGPEEMRSPFTFTPEQEAKWEAWRLSAKSRVQAAIKQEEARQRAEYAGIGDSGSEGGGSSDGSESSEEEEQDEEEVEEKALAAVMQLLDHNIVDNEYSNAIISAMAVMGINQDGGWSDPMNYTPKMSAFIKVARMLAVYSAYTARQQEMRAVQETGASVEEASQRVEGMFPRVRAMVRRFMTRIGSEQDQHPVPMDWILETRTYGMYIRFNTTAAASIDWKGDRVQFHNTKVRMSELTCMFHGMVDEARGLLERLTMKEKGGIAQLPAIPWDAIEDNNSEQRKGYWFLADEQNEWARKGDLYITKHINNDEQTRKWWITSENGPQQPFTSYAVESYSRIVDKFREILWCMMHMTSGAPARATEILGIRYRNTQNGGARNIFIHHGQVSFVTAYHKNFRQTNEAKIIHRFLPREVGELLIWYLWLVLPFWQVVQGIVKKGTDASAFLWGEQVVERRGQDVEDEDNEEWSNDSTTSSQESTAANWREYIRERRWTTDRVRRVMERQSQKHTGCKLTIASWRHIAIAIGRRYLGSMRGVSDDGEDDEDEIDDEAVDLQAGHGTHVAGLIYARGLFENSNGTALMREKFREASIGWHRLFAFTGGYVVEPGGKRKRERFESDRMASKKRRLERLQQVNVAGQLQQMLGPGARFRGQQQHVVEAIMRGDSTVIQVAGTGEGKSVSFMLPAYCSPEGVTVVISPLIALNDDLCRRSNRHGITSWIWKSRERTQECAIVYVTPDAACTQGFGEYVERLQQRMVLDRVVMDECHTIFDSFRPVMSRIGTITKQWGVQRVFLTATLEPRRMGRFCALARVDMERSTVVRSATTRKNIQYSVVQVKGGQDQQEEENEKIVEIVEQFIEKHASGKVIVYGGTIERVKALGDMLECSSYYSKVDTAENKAQMVQKWRDGERVIVSTNALGMGIDQPDIRLVVHAWVPSRIRDLVQESGRAGRDGAKSRSVVVCGAMALPKWDGRERDYQNEEGFYDEKERELETIEFAMKWQCRRIVLDAVMDGRVGREECGEDEEKCDVCMSAAAAADEEMEAAVFEYDGIDARMEREVRSSQAGQAEIQSEVMQGARDREAFEEFLEEWKGVCTYCKMTGRRETGHAPEDCRVMEQEGQWVRWRATRRRLQREVWEARRLAAFSGCFHCGIPQYICHHWEAQGEDEGSFRAVAHVDCQYKGLMKAFFTSAMELAPDRIDELVGYLGSDQFWKWMGQRVVIWNGVQTNRMSVLFYEICKVVAEEGDFVDKEKQAEYYIEENQ